LITAKFKVRKRNWNFRIINGLKKNLKKLKSKAKAAGLLWSRRRKN